MNRIVVNVPLQPVTIDRHIYGHFAEHLGRCIYEGLWVGEDSAIPNTRGVRDDVAEALRQIAIPNLRWPGGCFADEYHWQDGIGPRQDRPSMVNTHWGGVTEDNSFGTHEFLELCAQLGCDPYICGNLGSGTVQEMQQWVEYLNFDGQSPMSDLRKANGRDESWGVQLWGVGNENWGCGGNMRPEFYADQYRRYATYCRNLGGTRLQKIACGPNGGDYHWTEVLMREAGRYMDGLSLHYYCGTGAKSRSATQFEEIDWFEQLRRALHMDELVRNHVAIMDRYDPAGRITLAVDEWGAWHQVEPGTNPGFLYQQNTVRDALVAGLTLNVFNRHCRRVRLANIAQTVNVLQAMVLTEGARMLRTPTWHVFEMYKVHQDADLLDVEVRGDAYACEDKSIPMVDVSASRDAAGTIHLSLCNTDPNRSAGICCDLRGMAPATVSSRVLTAAEITAHNTFGEPGRVVAQGYDGLSLKGGALVGELPPMSVTVAAVRE